MSVILVWLLTGILVYEAIYRLQHPQEVNGKLMFIVASCGLGVNILMGIILHQSGHGHSHGLGGGHGGHGHSHGASEDGHYAAVHDEHEEEEDGGHAHPPSAANINVTAAFIHVLGDALQSVGVMIAAGLIWYNPEWKIADPVSDKQKIILFIILFWFRVTLF